jgi:hypothetical protein
MRFPALIWLLFMALSLPGCSLVARKKEAPEKEPAASPELVGRIASIPANQRFVLIQSYGSWKIEAGTVLTTRGLEERTANLLVTGETLGQFAAADIQAGAVEIGDAVFLQPAPKPAATAAEAQTPQAPENQQLEKPELISKNN